MKNDVTRRTLSIFWRYTRRYKVLFWSGIIGAIVGVLAQDILGPFIVARAFQKLQVGYALHVPLHFNSFLPYVFGYVAVNIIAIIVWRLQTYAVWEFEIRTLRNMIVDIFDHIQSMSQAFHANHFSGALVSQANKFVAGYERLVDEFVWNVVAGITALLFSFAVLLFVSWHYAVIMIVIVLVYIVIMSWRIRGTSTINRDAAETESTRTAHLADAITNVGTIRAYANEDFELSRFDEVATNSWRKYHELSRVDFTNSSISHSITTVFRITAFLFGIFAITNLHAKASVLYLVITYTTGIVDRLWQFSRVTRNINRSLGDASEMTEILAIKPDVQDPQHPEPCAIHRGGIDFKHVVFDHTHGSDQPPLFRGLDIRIKPGQKIGLVGMSGSGKTTLTSLLLRFMDVDSGEILIDGQNIAHMEQRKLRDHISYVPQEPMLFHRTIRENIGYGDLEADDRSIIGVSKMAHAHEFIERLEHGYDTLVGERGVKLSGGQRQRVAIARAMLKNAPILVLDEATSALDSESESLIQDALWKLMEGRTAIVIAHRLSTIQRMDRIVVMDRGKIVEQGSHKELIHANGTYAKLWTHQSGGFIES